MVLASIYLSISDRCPVTTIINFLSPNLLVFVNFYGSRPPSTTITTIEIWLLFNLAFPFLVIMVNIMLQVTSYAGSAELTMLLLQRVKEGNRKREMTTALPSMQILSSQVMPVSNMPNQPATKKAFEKANPEMNKLPKSRLVKWLEFTAGYVNPAIYIVFTVTFFTVSIISM